MSASSAAGRAEIDAALLLLSRMGITPEDLMRTAQPRPPAPTFAAYRTTPCSARLPGLRS
jgi:hypothetical protein